MSRTEYAGIEDWSQLQPVLALVLLRHNRENLGAFTVTMQAEEIDYDPWHAVLYLGFNINRAKLGLKRDFKLHIYIHTLSHNHL